MSILDNVQLVIILFVKRNDLVRKAKWIDYINL